MMQKLDANASWRDIFNVNTPEEVGAAYRKMSRKYHPDKTQGLSSEEQAIAAENFRIITEAYAEAKEEEVLLKNTAIDDSEKRADESLVEEKYVSINIKSDPAYQGPKTKIYFEVLGSFKSLDEEIQSLIRDLVDIQFLLPDSELTQRLCKVRPHEEIGNEFVQEIELIKKLYKDLNLSGITYNGTLKDTLFARQRSEKTKQDICIFPTTLVLPLLAYAALNSSFDDYSNLLQASRNISKYVENAKMRNNNNLFLQQQSVWEEGMRKFGGVFKVLKEYLEPDYIPKSLSLYTSSLPPSPAAPRLLKANKENVFINLFCRFSTAAKLQGNRGDQLALFQELMANYQNFTELKMAAQSQVESFSEHGTLYYKQISTLAKLSVNEIAQQFSEFQASLATEAKSGHKITRHVHFAQMKKHFFYLFPESSAVVNNNNVRKNY